MDIATRGAFGAFLALLFIVGLQAWLVKRAKQQAQAQKVQRTVSFWDLIITSEDEKYSLSRFQLYLWFVVIFVSYAGVSFAVGKLLELSEGLDVLLGINVGAAVASSAIATKVKGLSPKSDQAAPNFVADMFFEAPGSLDLPRTQMFAWTIIIALGYVMVLVESFIEGKPTLPNVPMSLAALMGISHGAYLGAKAVK